MAKYNQEIKLLSDMYHYNSAVGKTRLGIYNYEERMPNDHKQIAPRRMKEIVYISLNCVNGHYNMGWIG